MNTMLFVKMVLREHCWRVMCGQQRPPRDPMSRLERPQSGEEGPTKALRMAQEHPRPAQERPKIS